MNTHSIFLDVAETISQMSHCVSHKVGAILVKDKNPFLHFLNDSFAFEDDYYAPTNLTCQLFYKCNQPVPGCL